MKKKLIEYVWGCDPAVSRLAFAFAPLPDGPLTVESFATDVDASEGERLALLAKRVRTYAYEREREFLPAAAWVEQPSGQFRNPALSYATGVVQAALFEQLGCPVWTIPPTAWKKRAIGHGNASKAQVAAWVEDRSPDLASQDEKDAYAIACAGRAMFTSGEWDG